jgi:ABC-type sugar transport system substrate-binding protein
MTAQWKKRELNAQSKGKQGRQDMTTLHLHLLAAVRRPARLATAGMAIAFAAASFSAAQADGLADAKAAVEKAMEKPQFVAPGDPIDMGKLKGKHIWIITSTMAVPFVAMIAQGAKAAAEGVGMQASLFDGKGAVTEWNRGLAQAVSQHADGVITVGASPELMKGPMADALKANIPVVDAVTADQTAPLVPGTFAHVSISFIHSGELQADYAIAKSGGKAHVLILGDNEFPGEVSRVEGMQKEFAAKCPDCTVTVQDTQVGNLGVKLGQLVQTLRRRSPDINMVLPTYDAQAIYVVPAIKAANFDHTVEVIGSDAVPSNLDWIRQGNIQIADVGEPNVWLGWAAVDEVARGMLGVTAVDERIPLRLFTADNLKGVSNDENELFGGDYAAAYTKLWGLK